jgi:DNA invertase Pin-like site-specific DNA recombinase
MLHRPRVACSLTRSVQDWAKLADFIEQTGVELTLAGHVLDGAGLSVTHFVQHVLASFAEYERELIGRTAQPLISDAVPVGSR